LVMNNDICITGMGVVTPHGLTLESCLNFLKKAVPCEEGDLAYCADGSVFINEKKFLENSVFDYGNGLNDDYKNVYALEASQRALTDAGISSFDKIGTVISCSRPTFGRNGRWRKAVNKFLTEKKLNFEDISVVSRVDMPSLYVRRKLGISGLSCCVTSGCVTGLMSVIQAFRMIERKEADIILAGAVEIVPDGTFMASYKNMKVLTDLYENFRPFHKDRNGFFISEGCGMLVLESYESAKKRNSKIYAVIKDYAALSDPVSVTGMSHDGSVIAELLRRLKNRSGADIDYISCHGTATKLNDETEILGIKKAFGKFSHKISLSSIKPLTGHMLGASSVIEIIAAVLAMENNFIPPTIRLDNPDNISDLDFTPCKIKTREINYAVSASYGFGCSIAGLLLERHNCNLTSK